MKRHRHVLAALLLIAFPSIAEANAGTALMFAGFLHLVVGNLFIGILEGLFLARIFGLSRLKCVVLLIAANYVSAWMGGVFVATSIADNFPMGLESAWSSIWILVGITYMLTLCFEYPFVALAFWRRPSWRWNSIRASLLVQTVSYVLLFVWYWVPSGTSLYTETGVVDAASISLPEDVVVCFISAEDGDVYAGSLRERKWRKIHDLDSSHRNDRLFVRPSVAESGTWDLLARLETGVRGRFRLVTVRERFARIAVPSPVDAFSEFEEPVTTSSNYGPTPRLGDAESSRWEFSSGFWSANGFTGMNEGSGETVHFALDTPFVGWAVRNATHLPGDKVLLQLGEDQICVYDPETAQIALLVRGRGPVAVMGVRREALPTPAD